MFIFYLVVVVVAGVGVGVGVCCSELLFFLLFSCVVWMLGWLCAGSLLFVRVRIVRVRNVIISVLCKIVIAAV